MAEREPLLSADWYRVAFMRPRLRGGVRVSRQEVRGATWYVLGDPVSGRHHRFDEAAYALIGSCNGTATLDEVWAARVAADADNAPSQDEAIRVIAQGFGAGLLVGDIAPDAAAIVAAQGSQRARRRRAAINPFALRVPLCDPDRWLDARRDRLAWLFHPAARLACLLAIGLGLLLLLVNAGAVAAFARTELGSGRMLLLLWLVYPLLKALHELAHALAVKVHGGAVHELGISLMLLTPVPYVDASASIGFAQKWRRIDVAAAGIVVEALLASLALMLWLALEPGLARDLAFAVVFVGLLSTLVVNGNPLLRFDGYFVLCDAAELPNLGARSAAYWQSLIKRRLLGVRRSDFGSLARGERPWLLAYAPLAWAYRAVLLALFAVTLAQWSVALGLAVLALGLWSVLLKPAFAALRWIAGSPQLHGQRLRAAAVAGVACMALVTLAVGLPLPQRSHASAVVWLPDDAQVRAASEGLVERFVVADGALVAAGDVIAELGNEPLRVELTQAEAEVEHRRVEHGQQLDADARRAAWMEDELARLVNERDTLRARVAALSVRAGVAGRVVIDPRRVVPGRWLAQGELLAQVLPPGAPLVRALVRNDDIALVRAPLRRIEVQLAHEHGAARAARIAAAVPRASTALPTAALGEAGGGAIALDGADASGRTAREPRFAVDLRLDGAADARIGARALVTFDHGDASAAELVGRWLRQAFLRHFER